MFFNKPCSYFTPFCLMLFKTGIEILELAHRSQNNGVKSHYDDARQEFATYKNRAEMQEIIGKLTPLM